MNICVPEDAEQEDMFAAAKEAAVAAAKAAVEAAREEASTREFAWVRENASQARQQRAREAAEAAEAAAREVAAAEAAAAAAEKERMERLLVRLLAERLLYVPELGEFDLPHSIDVKEMPSKAVEALTKYGPYCGGGYSIHHTIATRVAAEAFDTLYLASNLEPWSRIIAEATARRRT